MKSRTKYYVKDGDIAKIFIKVGLGAVDKIESLDAGEFNTAYFVNAGGKEYVIKIAPLNDSDILTYEKNIMEREVYFYTLIRDNTSVRIPKVYFYDDSKSIIPTSYFIMERLIMTPLTDLKTDKDNKNKIYIETGRAVARLHAIKGSKFGYEQNGLYDNWYLAIRNMTYNLILDAKKKGKKTKYGERLISYIDKYKDILIKVSSMYTHFDIWDGNIFCNNDGGQDKIALIDTERGFWGDGIGDFVSIEMFKELRDKVSVKGYNELAKDKIEITRETEIRFNIMRAYLGLIVYTEKFFRYKRTQMKYLINVIVARMLLRKSFRILDNL